MEVLLSPETARTAWLCTFISHLSLRSLPTVFYSVQTKTGIPHSRLSRSTAVDSRKRCSFHPRPNASNAGDGQRIDSCCAPPIPVPVRLAKPHRPALRLTKPDSPQRNTTDSSNASLCSLCLRGSGLPRHQQAEHHLHARRRSAGGHDRGPGKSEYSNLEPRTRIGGSQRISVFGASTMEVLSALRSASQAGSC